MAKQISCGVLFVDTLNEKILMVHPTNQKDFWDFPKGRLEGTETPREAATREVFEETSIVLTEDDILFDYGHHPYNKTKSLHLFACYDKDINTANMKCTSMVEGLKTVFPEVDDFEFYSIEEAKELMCPSMKKVFVYEMESIIKTHFK